MALGDKVLLRGYSQENVFTLASNDPDWPMERIKREFGLTTYKEYHAAYGSANEQARARHPEELEQ